MDKKCTDMKFTRHKNENSKGAIADEPPTVERLLPFVVLLWQRGRISQVKPSPRRRRRRKEGGTRGAETAASASSLAAFKQSEIERVQ